MDKKSSTYDLIYQAKRYPPKLVYSLAHNYASGENLDRTTFGGAEGAECFKTLRELGFHIERKDFVTLLMNKFIEQAVSEVDLKTKEYPDEYCGLSVKVSFGQDSYSRVPGIFFTGYGQTVSNGIYPGLLYYKAIGVLLLTYGVSDTNMPIKMWNDLESKEKINEFMLSKYKHVPECYGESYIFKAYDVKDGKLPESITNDVDKIINEYHQLMSSGYTNPSKSVQPFAKKPEVDEYTVEQALDGLFIEPEKFQDMVELLRFKKNMILQGPPGVGTTFFSKRLAYALMGEKAPSRLEMVQFHQSYVYENFIQGYRPDGTGFILRDGVFHRFCDKARRDPGKAYVFVIDEINRGNLSKVFGELMMLIESDKRGPQSAITLTYDQRTV